MDDSQKYEKLISEHERRVTSAIYRVAFAVQKVFQCKDVETLLLAHDEIERGLRVIGANYAEKVLAECLLEYHVAHAPLTNRILGDILKIDLGAHVGAPYLLRVLKIFSRGRRIGRPINELRHKYPFRKKHGSGFSFFEEIVNEETREQVQKFKTRFTQGGKK